jgi:hypothetical protein
MNVLAFSVDSVYGGFGRCQGILRDEGKELCLEYEIRDNLIGALRSRLKQVRIPVDQIAEIRLKRGWFTTKLVIQTMTMDGVKDVPGFDAGWLTLSIARRDREAAQRFIDGMYS